MGNEVSSLNSFRKFSTFNTNLSVIDANSVASKNTEVAPEPKEKFSKLKPQQGGVSTNELTRIYYAPAPKKSDIEAPEVNARIIDGKEMSKFGVEMQKIKKLPGYVYKGLKGDPDANFYEYLSLSKIPYFIGGPMLALGFAFGITNHDKQAKAFAKARFHHVLAGVILYYAAVELAKKAIDIPVKLFRGVDLNQPYEQIVPCKASPLKGESPKKTEYHKVTESVDFTRWDLMTGDESKNNGKLINEKFDKLARKFGIDERVQDSDTTLKTSIKKLITVSTACKYALSAPFVVLAIALAKQPNWGTIAEGLGSKFKVVFGDLFNSDNASFKLYRAKAGKEKGLLKVKNFNYDLRGKERANAAYSILKNHVAKPIAESFQSLWKSSKRGKALILVSAIAPILANLRILQLTSEKNKSFVDISEYVPKIKKHQTNNSQ